MMITVIAPGLLSTIQDRGRWGYQAYGVSVAGAMDRFSCQAANLLVGNKPEAAVLEMTLMGGTFRFDQECYAAVAGADMQAALNGAKVENWSAFCIPAGGELTFGYAACGCRTYLAVSGGFDVPSVLGSRATYIRAAMGGLDGRALKAGDVLKPGTDAATAPTAGKLSAPFIPQYSDHIQLRVLLGPQDDLFEADGMETLFQSAYVISSEADRMGYRLEGPVIKHKGKADIVSDALCQGAIQVPGHGMPIIMMADRQTTGGYAKIGTVIGPDLAPLAQAKPGDSVRFVPCTEEQAVAALKNEVDTYAAIRAMLAAPAVSKTISGNSRCFQVKVNGQNYHVEIEEMES